MTGQETPVRPFYGPAAASGAKRLLLISYHFPPAQSAGALRWQKLAAYASERGWALDVVTLDPSQLDQSDVRRLAELPEDTRVYGARSASPRVEAVLERLSAAAARVRRRPSAPAPAKPGTGGVAADSQLVYPWQLNGDTWTPRGALRAVNAWRGVIREDPWGHEAARTALAIADPRVHHAVISCGPPHAAHDAARAVARRTGLPFIIDLRDPWGLAQAVERSRATPLFFALRARREAACVAEASLVVVNSETHLTALRAVHRRAANRVVCVLNGWDDEQVPAVARDGRFSLTYAGNIYLDRDPRSVFAAAARVVSKLSLSPSQFGIDLVGGVERFGGVMTADLARAAGIGEYVHLFGRRPRREALELMSRATMLLSLPQDLDLSVPSKIYEYFQFEAWLLALARPASGTGVLLRGTGADVVAPDDVDGIAAAIEHRYLQHSGGAVPPRLKDLNPRLSRGYQAAQLFDVLERVIPANG